MSFNKKIITLFKEVLISFIKAFFKWVALHVYMTKSVTLIKLVTGGREREGQMEERRQGETGSKRENVWLILKECCSLKASLSQ